MQDQTSQIQELIESLAHLRHEQQSILHRNHILDVNHIANLPSRDLEEYQRIQRVRNAKGKFLAELSGTDDDLKILLGQLSRLSQKRDSFIQARRAASPLDLPFEDLQAYTQLWGQSDLIAGMLERLCRDPRKQLLTCPVL